MCKDMYIGFANIFEVQRYVRWVCKTSKDIYIGLDKRRAKICTLNLQTYLQIDMVVANQPCLCVWRAGSRSALANTIHTIYVYTYTRIHLICNIHIDLQIYQPRVCGWRAGSRSARANTIHIHVYTHIRCTALWWENQALLQNTRALLRRCTALLLENQALLQSTRALLRKCTALLWENWALLQNTRALLRKCTALLWENRALLQNTAALLRRYTALLWENRALLRNTRALLRRCTAVLRET